MASFLEWTGANVFEERVTIAVNGDGSIEVFAASMPMGQGIKNSYEQLVFYVFGVVVERIRIIMGDTDRGQGFGSAGSRSLFTAGSALNIAAEKTVANGKTSPPRFWKRPPPTWNTPRAGSRSRDRPRHRPVRTGRETTGPAHLRGPRPARSPAQAGPTAAMWPRLKSIHETGDIDIVSYKSVNDVGRVVNPMIVRGQLDGGAAQGIGQALGEHMRYDR